MSDFKTVFKKLRISHGWTQREMAAKLGISSSSVAMYETGKREPDFEMLELIADFFNVDTEYLLGREKGSKYYFDPEVAEYAEFLREHPEYQELFDATRKVKPKDLELAVRMLGVFADGSDEPC